MDVTIERVYLPNCTPGSFYIDGKMVCKTLELKWANNKRGISCIPEGTYPVTKENPIPQFEGDKRNPRPYKHFRLHDTAPRSGILIHRGNYTRQIKGCILPGFLHTDIDKDGIVDVVDSTGALAFLIEHLPDKFTLTIKSKGIPYGS